jgi:perosamine synthetase
VSDKLFVPALPTLWPESLLRWPRHRGFYPFAATRARYFYFARNAIWFAVKSLGLEGQEVLVPSYHHGVEIEALTDAGAKVAFYRVGAKWDVDLEDVERRITDKTKALYLVHYAGFPGPAKEMRALADRHGIPLIEDCALSLLSADGSVPLGSTGHISIFCLYKTLPVPNGGAAVFNWASDKNWPEVKDPPLTSTFSHLASSLLQNVELRGGAAGRWVREQLRGVGRRAVEVGRVERVATGTQHFERQNVGLGVSAITRRIATSQDLPGVVERRRRNYFTLLSALHDVAPPLFSELPAGVCPLFFPLPLENKLEVKDRLVAKGVEAIDFWRYFHPACPADEFPEVARLRETILEIPCHQDLSTEAMGQIAAVVREAIALSAPSRGGKRGKGA